MVSPWAGDIFLLVIEGSALVFGYFDAVVLCSLDHFGLVSARPWRLVGFQPTWVRFGDGEVGQGWLNFGAIGSRSWNCGLLRQRRPLFLADYHIFGLGMTIADIVPLRPRQTNYLLLVLKLQLLSFPNTKRHHLMLQLIQLFSIADSQQNYYDPGPGTKSVNLVAWWNLELMLNPFDLTMDSVILSGTTYAPAS